MTDERLPKRDGFGVEFVVHARPPDVDRWIAVFEQTRPLRNKHGAIGHRFLRNMDDPNEITLVIDFTSPGGARGYADEVARLAINRAAGMDGHRGGWHEVLLEPIEAVEYPGSNSWRCVTEAQAGCDGSRDIAAPREKSGRS